MVVVAAIVLRKAIEAPTRVLRTESGPSLFLFSPTEARRGIRWIRGRADPELEKARTLAKSKHIVYSIILAIELLNHLTNFERYPTKCVRCEGIGMTIGVSEISSVRASESKKCKKSVSFSKPLT
jgi:hypothetical protein